MTLNGSAVIGCEGGTVTVTGSMPEGWVYLNELTIKSPVDVTVVMTDENAITPRKCEVTLNIPENLGPERVFDCVFYVNSKIVGGCTISQHSCNITVDTPEITFDYIGGSAEILVETAGSWTVEVIGDWITATPGSGKGDGIITITVPENELVDIRTGYVYVTNGSEKETIIVTQLGANPYLYFSKHYIPVKSSGDTKRVKLYNNIQ